MPHEVGVAEPICADSPLKYVERSTGSAEVADLEIFKFIRKMGSQSAQFVV